MAQKEYKELSCRDTGADCDFLVRAETTEEVISVASEHGCRVHQVCEITPEARDRMNSLTEKRLVRRGICRYPGGGTEHPAGRMDGKLIS